MLMFIMSLFMWLLRRRAARDLRRAENVDSEKNFNFSGHQKADDDVELGNYSIENIGHAKIKENNSVFERPVVTPTAAEAQRDVSDISVIIQDRSQRHLYSPPGEIAVQSFSHQQSLVPDFSADSSNPFMARTVKRMSRLESFPFEEYGIPVEDRQPIRTRVHDLKTYDTYFHLTPIEPYLLREDSIAEDDY